MDWFKTLSKEEKLEEICEMYYSLATASEERKQEILSEVEEMKKIFLNEN